MEYYLGLDMGTTSVGWAVTDKKYNILRAKGKDLWGIREFDEAKTAVKRRTNRISRRRRQREIVRIGMLKSFFHDEIEKIDPYFYIRLENSKYYAEDKDDVLKSVNAFFDDDDFKDKDYFEKYPTIFHLRKELMESDTKYDIRLIFLALLHMFKHRGHFLYGEMESSENNFIELYETLKNDMEDICEINLKDLSETDIKKLESILGSREYSKTVKSEKVAQLLEIDKKDKREFAIVKLMCGRKIKCAEIYSPDNTEEEINVDFTVSNYDEQKDELINKLGEERYSIIETLKKIYDLSLLSNILHGEKFLSNARVKLYEKHSQDLKILKEVIRKYFPEKYDHYFRSIEKDSYSAYIGSINTDNNKQRRICSPKDCVFVEKLKKLFPDDIKDNDEDVQKILSDLDKDTFLPKQMTSQNGVIPNKLHADEMELILKNAQKHYSFLGEKDETGLSVAEKILQIFKFQLPYYVGPTLPGNNKKGENRWVVRKEEGKILPWNIWQKIDKDKTGEEFITRMTRHCTYICDEKALPRHSLLYERFCVLNEINNLKINGEKISVELKQEIYNELFMTGKKVTKKKLVDYFVGRGLIEVEQQLSGVDININNSLSSIGKFKEIFGDKIKEDKYKTIAEEIIYFCTIHGEDKKTIKEHLEKKYSEVLDDVQIKRITGFKFKDWGNLSKEFLELQGCKKSDGLAYSLVGMMWESNLNFNELLNDDDYTYKENLEDKTKQAEKTLSDFEFEDLDEYYFSAPVKRMIWQAIKIIREIELVMGFAPKRIFVEMTRSHEQDPKRKESRANKFKDLYKKIKDESIDWAGVIDKADGDGSIRSKKMYLYLTQMGRCMYTGEPIELNELFTTNYDIDHIYPRHFVSDNSIENNLVLVKKEKNAHKSDAYPIEQEIRNSQKMFWENLKNKNLITQEKFVRLTGNAELTDEQKAGFIARQLVETGQATKGVSDILKMLLPDTELVYSKASNVSAFRQQFDIPKSRIVNEYHHAHDAYLNIVVGNIYLTKFTRSPRNFIKEASKDKKEYNYNLSRMFDWDVKRGDVEAWIAPDNVSEVKENRKNNENEKLSYKGGTIETVRKMILKNTPLMTRYSFEQHGEISDANPVKKDKINQGDIFIKNQKKLQDLNKYGGLHKPKNSHFILVEHEDKKGKIRTIETVPIFLNHEVKRQSENLKRYCSETLGLINPNIIVECIKIQSLVRRNGYYLYLSGKSDANRIQVRNAVNLNITSGWIEYIKKIEKYDSFGQIDEIITEEKNLELYKLLNDKHTKSIYKNRPNPCGEKIKSGFEKFTKLKKEEQVKTLYEILKLSMIGISEGNLEAIGASKTTGKMLISKKVSDADEFVLINQSVTGLFKKEVDLLTI